jgi:hypothetical protein
LLSRGTQDNPFSSAVVLTRAAEPLLVAQLLLWRQTRHRNPIVYVLPQYIFSVRCNRIINSFLLSSILVADIATASFLIAFGVVLGRLSPGQYLMMVLIQMPLFAANEHLVYGIFKVEGLF